MPARRANDRLKGYGRSNLPPENAAAYARIVELQAQIRPLEEELRELERQLFAGLPNGAVVVFS